MFSICVLNQLSFHIHRTAKILRLLPVNQFQDNLYSVKVFTHEHDTPCNSLFKFFLLVFGVFKTGSHCVVLDIFELTM